MSGSLSIVSFLFIIISIIHVVHVVVHHYSLAVDFFNQINMLYGTITEQCTTESCPVMSAGPK